MSDRIESVLSASEWRRLEIGERPLVQAEIMLNGRSLQVADDLNTFHDEEVPKLIALANHALPDDDPRKITRETIRALRSVTIRHEPHEADGMVWRIADALESYLPPETP